MSKFAALALLAALAAFGAGCKRKTEPATPAAPDPGGPGAVLSDQDRLQGVWAVGSLQDDPPGETVAPEFAKSARYQFQGDRLGIAFKGRVTERFTIVVHAEQNPKLLTLTAANARWQPDRIAISVKTFREPGKHEWLYRFDGNQLVLAETVEPGLRPVDFKPRKRQEPKLGEPRVSQVIVVTLTKTAEAPLPDAPPSGTAWK